MKLHFVPKENLEHVINDCIAGCDEFRGAVGFVKSSGISALGTLLSERGRIIVDTRMGFTEASAIKKLQDMGVSVRTYRNAIFHPKLYIFHKKDNFQALCGSSNLTNYGFSKNVEANVFFEGKTTDPIYESLREMFEEWWNNSEEITPAFLAEYKKIEAKMKSRDKIQKDIENDIETKIPIPPPVDNDSQILQKIETNFEKGQKIWIVPHKEHSWKYNPNQVGRDAGGSYQYLSALKNINDNDIIIYYVPTNQVAGIFKAKVIGYTTAHRFEGTDSIYTIDIEPVTRISKNLVGISRIRKSIKKSGVILRGPPFPITLDDFAVFKLIWDEYVRNRT